MAGQTCLPHVFQRSKVRPSLEKCEEIKMGVEVGTPPRSTAPRAPLLFRHVQFHVRSRFLKNRDGFCNACVPEALPLTLGVGGGCRGIFVEGGSWLSHLREKLDLEAGTGCSVLALQQFTGHFGHSLSPPGPQLSCSYNGMSSQVPSSLSSSITGLIQSNFLGSQQSLPTKNAFRTRRMSLHSLRQWVTTRDQGKPVLSWGASCSRTLESGRQ